MIKEVDHTLPDGKWQFDDEVTRVFGDMLERSIPQYEVMREATAAIVCKFARNGDYIIDLGCSNGLALQPLVDRLRDRVRYLGVDISEPMLAQARARFKDVPRVKIQNCDLRREFPRTTLDVLRSAVIQAVLCLCFIPMEYRQKVVVNCYRSLRDGGALVIVDKLLGETAEINELFVTQYLDKKLASGYSEEEILRKRLALEGVLVPLTGSWEQHMLQLAGFRYVDCYWRWMNFAGWIAVK